MTWAAVNPVFKGHVGETRQRKRNAALVGIDALQKLEEVLKISGLQPGFLASIR